MKRHGARFAKALTRIMRDPRISVGAKALYVLLKTYCDENGHCFPSLWTLAHDLGVDRKKIVRDMAELVEWRIVVRCARIVAGSQTTTDYFVDDDHFAKHCARPRTRKPSDRMKVSAGPKKGPPGRPQIGTTEVDPLKKSDVIAFPGSFAAGA